MSSYLGNGMNIEVANEWHTMLEMFNVENSI